MTEPSPAFDPGAGWGPWSVTMRRFSFGAPGGWGDEARRRLQDPDDHELAESMSSADRRWSVLAAAVAAVMVVVQAIVCAAVMLAGPAAEALRMETTPVVIPLAALSFLFSLVWTCACGLTPRLPWLRVGVLTSGGAALTSLVTAILAMPFWVETDDGRGRLSWVDGFGGGYFAAGAGYAAGAVVAVAVGLPLLYLVGARPSRDTSVRR
jgi:hypothetical protein